MTPTYAKVCYEDAIANDYEQIIVYGSGSYSTFALVGAPAWVTINSTNGRVAFDKDNIDAASIGVWTFTITYLDGAEVAEDQFTLVIEKCVKLNSTSISFCSNESPKTFQFGVEGKTASAFTMDETITGLSLSSGGLLTQSGTGYLDLDITVNYTVDGDNYTETVHITSDNCVADAPAEVEMCETDLKQIVWKNDLGGNESFCFVQDKTYFVKQEKDIRYKNSSREQRFASRGDVWDYVEVLNQQVPSVYIDKIRSLRDSIQAWVADDVADAASYTAIILDPGDFIISQAGEQYFSLSFKFKYAKNKLIQRQ